jgi:hypothetical protein
MLKPHEPTSKHIRFNEPTMGLSMASYAKADANLCMCECVNVGMCKCRGR